MKLKVLMLVISTVGAIAKKIWNLLLSFLCFLLFIREDYFIE